MRRNMHDWLLHRDDDAGRRLDSIRQEALEPERVGVLETVAEIFRPNLGAWTVLAFVWMALVAAHFEFSSSAASATRPGREHNLVDLKTTRDEALSLLDTHP
jgi:hypothetical protein